MQTAGRSPKGSRRTLRPVLPEVLALLLAALLVAFSFYAEPTFWADVHARYPPLSAVPERVAGLSWLRPVAVALVVVVVGPRLARTLPWRWLLAATWLTGVVWGLSLALVRGWEVGIVEVLTNPAEYLADLDRAGNMGPLLAGFAEHIVYSDPEHWTTQVAGHPPLSFLFYLGLDRIGLGGPAAGGIITALLGTTGIVAVLVTLRALGERTTARRAAPFLALAQGFSWIFVSADGLFMAVLAWGVALGACAVRKPRRRVPLAVASGVVLGSALFLSYGLVLALPIAVAALWVRRRWWPLLPAVAGAGAVTAGFTALGFWWFEGQSLVVIRYYEGIGTDRPYGYWVWANLAVLAIALGPAAVAGFGAALGRIPPRVRRRVALPPSYWLAGAALLGILAATLSGLSKSEVERIWLPFMVWLMPLAAATDPSRHRLWLLAQAGGAIALEFYLHTSW